MWGSRAGGSQPYPPPTGWTNAGTDIHRYRKHKVRTIQKKRRRGVVYLNGEKSCSGDSDPAVQGVDVGSVIGIVEVKHSTEPHDRQDQGEEHQCSMQQLPGEFVLAPSHWDTVQHSSCREKKQQRCKMYLKMI